MKLADQIASHLAGTGRPLTTEEIARGIRRRTVDVRRALETDARFARWPSERKKLYGVVTLGSTSREARDGLGRAAS